MTRVLSKASKKVPYKDLVKFRTILSSTTYTNAVLAGGVMASPAMIFWGC